MRLLDTANITLHEFHGQRIPQYVILSHTWEYEEVSFQDIQSQESKHLAGYEKITRCCQLAASEGWKYVWIDTCCIDKRSSAELSEAINSMFRWYRDAQVCYAYLNDVLGTSPDDFRNSRWFTRGWTLQELLAPGIVIFYNAFWEVLDTKRSLRKELSLVTGISIQYMIDPTSASVATKMSWASRRRTTRIEDVAYCLLGLFDVNMPLLYGEGDKAFMRLQHEIVKVSEDESIFAWRDSRLHRSGAFALSPAAFGESGDIVPHDFPDFPRQGLYTVTNRGLSFEHMALHPIADQDCPTPSTELQRCYLAPLHCAWSKDEHTPVCLVLRELTSADNIMVREQPWDIQLFHLDQCKPSLFYRTLYIKPFYSRSQLSTPVQTQSLILRFRATVGSNWNIKCMYNGGHPTGYWVTEHHPTGSWWNGWQMKFQPDDLRLVLIISAENENFFLILQHDTTAPRVNLLIPPVLFSVANLEELRPPLEGLASFYQGVANACEKDADSYSCTLQTGENRVEVFLSKHCVDGCPQMMLDVSVKNASDDSRLDFIPAVGISKSHTYMRGSESGTISRRYWRFYLSSLKAS